VDELDLPDDCWTAPIGDVDVGDVCEALPLAALCGERLAEVLFPDGSPQTFFVPARFSFGVVMRVLDGYALIASVGTRSGTGDEASYSRLVATGRSALTYIRLPAIPADRHEAWEASDGVAFLSLVESFPVDYELLRLRVATMNDPARELFRRRVARLFEA
jgi:hypothetical protein